LLDEGRGVLVPYRDAATIAREVITVLGDDEGRLGMCARARAHGIGMTWSAVAGPYLATFDRARTDHEVQRQRSFRAQTLAARHAGLPEITLKHVQAMTD